MSSPFYGPISTPSFDSLMAKQFIAARVHEVLLIKWSTTADASCKKTTHLYFFKPDKVRVKKTFKNQQKQNHNSFHLFIQAYFKDSNTFLQVKNKA